MIFRGRFNTVFYKITVSFIAIVLLVALIIGMTSYYYFSSNFNSKVEQVNEKMLDHLDKMISNNIMTVVQKAYMDIFINSYSNGDFIYLFNNNIRTSSTRVYNAYETLKNIVNTNSDVINSIYIYYKENNAILSYPEGIKYLDDIGSIIPLDTDIIKQFSNSGEKAQWIEARKLNITLSANRIILSVLYKYQLNLSGAASQGCIMININEGAFYEIIKQSYPDEAGCVFIMDWQGRIISHSNEDLMKKYLAGNMLIDPILPENKNSGSIMRDMDGVKSIITFITLAENNWKLVNVTPVDQYYRESVIIQRTFLVICLVAIFIGLFMANMFSIKIYKPIKAIVDNTRKLPSNLNLPANDKKQNEYMLINNVINNLSVKVVKLENTIISYRPLIKHNIVFDLVNNNIKDKDELLERLTLAGLSMEIPYFNVMVIEIEQDVADNLSVENSLFVKYNIINQIESENNENTFYMAAVLTNYRICAIINSKTADDRHIVKMANQLAGSTYANFKLHMAAAIGDFVENPMDVHLSLQAALSCLKYHFIMPEANVITRLNICGREESREKLPNELINRFSYSLKSNNVRELDDIITELVEKIKSGPYAIDNCRHILAEFLSAFLRYVNDIGCDDIIPEGIYESYNHIQNINRFQKWFITIIKEMIKHMELSGNQRQLRVVESVRKYIVENLDEQFSLETVAEKFSISPSYLSKIFKYTTCVKFVDFINMERMEKAKELLKMTDLNIDSVAVKIGFNNTNYFIKKFREAYGITPKFYKMSHTDE